MVTVYGAYNATVPIFTSSGPVLSLVSVDGGITPAGALTRGLLRSVAGSISPSGVVVAVTAPVVLLAGLLLPSGGIALLQNLSRFLVGFIEPRGPLSILPIVTTFFRVVAEYTQRYRRFGGS